ncbi:hypothetical protein TWF481_003822 [Arthrobotrys musiformis]|uniref:Uncharacterized protein n=1 Tax=Arthrobotrys musiformis TaxID=47236 RepID=A0AAV9WHU3_9PEZI
MEQTRRVKEVQQEIISNALLACRIRKALRIHYEAARRQKGVGAYKRMTNIVMAGIEQSKVFQDIRRSIGIKLRDLTFQLNVENATWCFSFERLLNVNIKQWTLASHKIGQVEGQEKEKLRSILSDFEKRRERLVSDIKRLEEEARI